LSEEEAWAFVADAHTGILTTLRRDGSPIALPIWFAVVDRRIYVTTRGKKVARVRHDPRCSFLVEAGERWAELEAVHMACTGRVLDTVAPDLLEAIRAETRRKYDAYRTPTRAMPEATRAAYDPAAGAIIEITVTGKILTWDNRRLGLS
jgi:hypothetical protein